jgi:DNA-binding CsgD family transcriptional regulator
VGEGIGGFGEIAEQMSNQDWREITAVAVVLGDISPHVVARYCGVSAAEATSALAVAAEHGIITDGAINDFEADRLISDLSAEALGQLHLQVVRWLLIHGWTDLDDLVRHTRAAAAVVVDLEVVGRIDHAAKVALYTSDYDKARVLLELADELGSGEEIQQRAARFCRLAEAYHGMGQVSAAREAAGVAFNLAESLGDGDLCLEAAVLSIYPTDWHAGDLHSAALLQRLEELGPPLKRRAAVHAVQAIAKMRIPVHEHEGLQVAWVTRASLAQPLAVTALAVADATSRADRLLAVLAWRTCHRAPQFLQQRRELSLEALDLSQELHLPSRQVEAACFLAVDAMESCDLGLYERALSVAKWVANKDRNPLLLAHVGAAEAGAAFRSGDIDAGVRLRAEALDYAASASLSSAYSLEQVLLAQQWIALDEPPPIDLMPADTDPILQHPLARAAVAVGWARLGENNLAAQYLSQSLRGVDEESSLLLHLCVAAEAATLLGASAEVEQLIALLTPWAHHVAVDGNAWWPDRPVSAALAELCASAGDVAAAETYLAVATEAATMTNDPRTSRRMDRLHSQLRNDHTSEVTSTTPLSPFTLRQRQIMTLVATGATNRDISQQLAYSTSTIKAEMAAILKVLSLDNRTQLAALVSENPQILVSIQPQQK